MDWRRTLGLRPAEQRSWLPDPPIPTNGSLGIRYGSVRVNPDSALSVSAAWACLDLRAGLLASFPIDVYSDRDGQRVEMSKPAVLVTPAGPTDADPGVALREWMYSTQMDKDRAGNAFGLVTEFSGLKSARWPKGIPARIELVLLGEVSVLRQKGVLKYRIRGKLYDWWEVWHEKSHTLPGLDVGLSPTAYAAYSLGGYLSAQKFALEWFGGSGMPAAHLKNTAKAVSPNEAEVIKQRYRASVKAGDVFASGADWELKPITAVSAQNDWIAHQQFTVSDTARFYGCPVDLIDGAVAGQSVTYANISERNLQFLIMKLGPAIDEREDALGTLTPSPRYVKINTKALLRLDPLKSAQLDAVEIGSWTLTPDEARAKQDRPPLTPEDIAQLQMMAPKKTPDTTKPAIGAAA
jgi:HK97 family phage portal protein